VNPIGFELTRCEPHIASLRLIFMQSVQQFAVGIKWRGQGSDINAKRVIGIPFGLEEI